MAYTRLCMCCHREKGNEVTDRRVQSGSGVACPIVLGAPRGGTSVTAGILDVLGVDLGDLRGPDDLNPRGYYEDKELLNLCSAIFEEAREDADGFSPPSRRAIAAVGPEFERDIRSYIERRRAAGSGVWGWKATSMAYLVDLFLPYLESVVLIVVTRSPYLVARSAVSYTREKSLYDSISLEDALATTIDYYDAVVSVLRRWPNIRREIIAYEEIIEAPVVVGERLAGAVGVQWDNEKERDVLRLVGDPTTLKTEKRAMSLLLKPRRIVERLVRMIRRFGGR